MWSKGRWVVVSAKESHRRTGGEEGGRGEGGVGGWGSGGGGRGEEGGWFRRWWEWAELRRVMTPWINMWGTEICIRTKTTAHQPATAPLLGVAASAPWRKRRGEIKDEAGTKITTHRQSTGSPSLSIASLLLTLLSLPLPFSPFPPPPLPLPSTIPLPIPLSSFLSFFPYFKLSPPLLPHLGRDSPRLSSSPFFSLSRRRDCTAEMRPWGRGIRAVVVVVVVPVPEKESEREVEEEEEVVGGWRDREKGWDSRWEWEGKRGRGLTREEPEETIG